MATLLPEIRLTYTIIRLREAIAQAKSKADACRKVMQLETCGYIRLSNVTDERKAELVNPFAGGRYEFCGQDFCQARNRQ